MRRIFTILLIVAGLFVNKAIAQTTLNTTVGSTGYTGGNGVSGNSAILFVIENTSGGAILLDDVGDYFQGASNGATVTLWYSSTSLSGAPTIATPDWTSIATGTISVTTDGIVSCFTSLGFLIPNGAQYRFAIQSSTNIRYSGAGAGACTPSIFTSNGISLKCGDAQIGALNVGYAGAFPNPANNPRWFTGYVTLNPAGPCTSPPTPGTVVSTSNPVCFGNNFTLSLTGGTAGTGQIYKWQSSPDSTNWTDITGAMSPTLQTNQIVTTFYRAVITCGATFANTPGLKILTPPAFPGGAYTINSAVATGGTNFANFADAINAIKCGIGGSIVFNVTAGSGPYTEQVIIPAIGGASATKTVTFNGNGETLTFDSANTNTNARAVLKLDGADFVTIKNLNIDATGGTYGWGIHLTNQADNDSIVNCTLTTDANSTSANFAGIVISGSNTSAITGGNNANKTVIMGNTINFGYYGIVNYGTTVAPFTDSVQIINNTVNDFYLYGIYTYGSTNGTISGNTIQRPIRSAVTTSYGIYVGTYCSGMLVEKNKVKNLFDGVLSSTAAAYCIYIIGDGSPTSPNKIVNNIISDISSEGAIYGIYNVGAANMQAYHNTISLDYVSGSAGLAYGFYQTTSDTGIVFKNNIITITRGGTGAKVGIYKATPLTPLISNFNNVYVNSAGSGTQSYGYYNSAQATLTDWQTASSHDLNSVSIDPLYTALGSDYSPTAVSLNNRGTPAGVLFDINGAVRSTTNPDMGAIEFSVGACTTPPTAGTAVGPSTSYCANALFLLQLTGNSAGLGQTYQWESSASATGPWVAVGSSIANPDTAIMATATLYYRVAVTCSGNTAYSTPVLVTIDQPISGTYTINSTFSTGGTNFQSFTDAILKLRCGVTGPVTFNVVTGSGPYTEQVSIPALSGTSATNRVTFNCNGETLQFAPVTTARHILQMNGADYVSINNLNIVGQDPTYGYGIHLQNGSDYDSINNCTVDLTAVTSTTVANNSCIVASNSGTSTTTPGNTANNLVITNTTTKGGYYGVVLYGDATNTTTGNKVLNCTIQDFYSGGIYIFYNSGGSLSNNDISRANSTTVGTFYGVNMGTSSRNFIINANRIHDTHTSATTQTGAAYGIQLLNAVSRPGFETKITNNLLYNFNSMSGTIYALYNSASDSALYYHNTVVLDNAAATGGATYAVYQTGTGSGLQYKNNILYTTRTGTATKYLFYFLSPTSPIVSNNNVLYMNSTGGTNSVGYYAGTPYTTLADWKTANSGAFDQQSVGIDPLFTSVSTADFKPTEPNVNDIGQNVGVATDILGTPRNITAPDPGAYEFSLGGCANPPAAGTVTAPVTNVCAGSTFSLDLTGNSSGAGQTYQWQTSPDNISWINAGSVSTTTSFTTSQTVPNYYRCGVTCSGGTTVYTTGVLISTPALVSGTFTINSGLPTGGANFATFTEAVDYMKCGISGPVTFNVASGSSYTEQVIIPSVSGTSSTNRIIFNGNGANISYTSTLSSERAIIKLKGTDYVTIDSLNITATGTADTEYGYGIQLLDNADHNTISRCIINVTASPVTITSSNFAGIVINTSSSATPTAAGNSQCDSNTIISNTIIGGSLGISIIANGITNSISGNVIKNNVIQDFYSYGIYLNGNYNAMLEGNDISRPTRASIGTFYGIFMTTGNVGFKISKNRIHDPFTGNATSTSICYGVYTSGSDGVDGNENIISNNMVYGINNIGSQYAFYNTGSNFIKYYYNSILLDGPASSTTAYVTRGFYQSTTDTAVEFVNNIVSISRPATGPVQGIYIAPTIINFKSDFNNFNIATTTGTFNSIGYINGTQYATLADWRTGSLKDSNSISADPLFVSATDLHIQTASPCVGVGIGIGNVPTDIDDETRPGTNTDMGADEIGAIVPVTLKSITAVIARQNAIVNWSTAAELNLNRFEVERSLDGSRFTNAGTVAAIAAGTNYSFTDYEIVNKVAANTVIYYRLKMIDRDGRFKYSVVVTVKTGNNSLVSVYPNPFMKELFVKMNAEKTGSVNIKLTDQTGRLVTASSKKVLSGASILSIPVSDKIAAGTYILSIEMGGENYIFKVVK